jgi:Tol biopolymer transport system component
VLEGPAEEVGAYLFPDDAPALAAYEARLREHGVDPFADGPCAFSFADARVTPDALPIAGCFINEFDRPNLRMAWPGQNVLVGVLGRPGSIATLGRWARSTDEETAIDVWTGGLGSPAVFDACPDVSHPARVRAPQTLMQESEGLVLSEPDGSDLQRLSLGGLVPSHTEWSPDGRSLAFAADGRIWLVEPAGGRPRSLVRAPASAFLHSGWTDLAWAPNGNSIAYLQWRTVVDSEGSEEQRPSIWVVDVGSGETLKIADGAILEWAPDSTRLLMRSPVLREYDPGGPIAVVDLASGSLTSIGAGYHAKWSPDCRSIAVISPSDTGTVVILEGATQRPRLAFHAQTADWSPATGDLAVGSGDGDVWVIPMDGKAPRRLAQGGGPLWSPDGTKIAYGGDQGLFVANADGSDSTLVASAAYPLTGPVIWSADGRYLASSSEPTGDTCGGPEYGWVIATDGSGVRSLPEPYHARWRPIDPTPPPAAVLDDKPPKPSEGCGG